MPQSYDRNDLLWDSLGDFRVGGDGDLQDTKFDPLRSLVQEIKTRIEADIGDWSVYPSLGASFSDFVGEPNTPLTAENIKVRVITSLTKDGFISSKDVTVTIIPIDRDKIMMRIKVLVAPTNENGKSESLTISSVYSYSENNIYFVK